MLTLLKTSAIAVALSMLPQVIPGIRVQEAVFNTPDGRRMPYGRAVPDDYDSKLHWPLVVALHPGGERTPNYGTQYMRGMFLPGLAELRPIMIAPDCPARSWTDPVAEQAVIALIEDVLTHYSIDRKKVVVVGFSMGGTGAWFLESRHAEFFTAAIVMAGSTKEPVERLARIPTYVIHSRDDQVVAFNQAQEIVNVLGGMGRPVKFDALDGLSHFDMIGYLPALKRAESWLAESWKR